MATSEVYVKIPMYGDICAEVEIEYCYHLGSGGPDPDEIYWDAYERVDGLLKHPRLEDAVGAWFEANASDLLAKHYNDYDGPDEGDLP